MNMKWVGDRDMTLHRLGRTELLNQFDWIRRNVGTYEKSEVFVMKRDGRKARVVKVTEDGPGAFVHTVDEDFGALVNLAPYVGSDMRIMDLDALEGKLRSCSSEDVWLEWPCAEPETVVGKVFSVNAGGTLTVSLTPVPKDIEEVNERVHGMVSAKCELAKAGTRCGNCPSLPGCGILREADEAITKEREG